jgi:hypothetical protein
MPEQTLSEISVTLGLSKGAHAKLCERAAAAGQPLAEYIATLVESVVEAPLTPEQISGPVYQRFLESQTTDEELSEELERAKHEMRAERRARQAS